MTQRVALFPGTFDPVTLGHLDLMRRGARLFDALIVCVAPDGKSTWLSQERRVALVQGVIEEEGLAAVSVEGFEGLLVEHAVRRGAQVLLRGLRTFKDFEYEVEMAFANRKLEPAVETIFLPPGAATARVSSSLVREVFSLGGDVSSWLPTGVLRALSDLRG